MRIQTDRESRRAWLYWGGDMDLNYICFELGRLLSGSLGFRLGIGSEQQVLGIYLGILDFYISLSHKGLFRWLHKHPNFKFSHKNMKGETVKGEYWEERNVGLRLDLRDWVFAGELWTNMNGEPRKRHFFWFIADKLFGMAKHSTKVFDEGEILIDMPEGVYKGTYRRFTSYWKRPRLWFSRKVYRMMIDVPVGIPHQGKGENSYDMGMDATFSSVFPIKKEEGLRTLANKFAMDCLKDRQKTGRLSDPDYARWKMEGEARLANKNETPDIVGASDLTVGGLTKKIES